MSEKETKAKDDFKAVNVQSAQKEVEKELAKKSADNKSKGLKNEKLSLTKVEEVEVIKDGKFLKKGTVIRVSEKAALVYRKKGLIK